MGQKSIKNKVLAPRCPPSGPRKAKRVPKLGFGVTFGVTFGTIVAVFVPE